MHNIYLLRHGKTLGKPALNGHSDVAVDETIQRNIADALLQKYTFNQVYSSPLKRCHRVAELITDQRPELNLEVDPRLKEQYFGEFDGVAFDDLTPYWNQLEQFWQNPAQCTLPQAEPLQEGFERVIAAWEQIAQQCDQDTLIIAHGGPIRYILAHVLGLDWQNSKLYTTLSIQNQSITHIQLSRFEGQAFFSVKAIGMLLI